MLSQMRQKPVRKALTQWLASVFFKRRTRARPIPIGKQREVGGGYASEAQYLAPYTQEIPRPLGIGRGCSGPASRRDRFVGRRESRTGRPSALQRSDPGKCPQYYARHVLL